MGLLDATQPSKHASHARLVLELDELARTEWAPLSLYATVRGIPTLAAARRSLFRLKNTLAAEGAELELKIENYNVSARFGTKEIVDLIEQDLRAAREIVEVLDAKREGREPDLEALACDAEVVSPETLAHDFHERLKPQEWIARKHGIGVKRLRRILESTGGLARPEVRRVEQQRSPFVVADALAAAKRGELIEEIARILGCSTRTAKRFVKRHGIALARGLRLGAKVCRAKKGKKVAPKSRSSRGS